MSLSFKTMMAAALAFGGAMVLQPEPASAQQGYHLYRNGVRVTGPAYVPYRQGFRTDYGGPRYGFGGGYRSAYYGRGYGYRTGFYGPRYGYGYGYRPAYYGSRYYGGYYPYRSYRRGYSGGAVAAGLIGGLALGAIASAATSPYYYGGYYSPAYYTPARTCYVERRRFVNRYGRVGVRRVQTCY